MANFQDSYPAKVKYADDVQKNISFLLQPKENYTNSYFEPKYAFKLLCGSTSKDSNISDIYINQKYADYLLKTRGYESDQYKKLLNESIQLPYSNKYSKDINLTYCIKGIIDEADEKYIYYKNYIGDFFLANQYLSLPIQSSILFKLEKTTEELKTQIDTLLAEYKYETIGRHFNALMFSLAYDFRIVPVSPLGSENNILNITNENNILFNTLSKLYDFYFNKEYIISLIIVIISILIIFIVLFIVYRNLIKEKCNVKFVFALFILGFPGGVLFNFLFKQLFFKTIPLSIFSWQSFLFMFLALIIQLLIFKLMLKKSTK